jgi:alkylresorcinol/alkylpyrone synthase
MSFPANPKVVSVGTALPQYSVNQEQARALTRSIFSDPGRDLERLLRVFDNGHVKRRYLSAPLEWYYSNHTWSERNAIYVETALELSERSIRIALERANLTPKDLDAIFYVSTTGLSTPSIDSLLIKRLDMNRHVARVPIWGLGCAGGASGLNRALDYARAYPSSRVLMVSCETSSLTFQANDPSRANLVSVSIFGDGCAAAVVSSHPDDTGFEALRGHSTLWDETEDVMGWEVVDTGMKVTLSKSVPEVVKKYIRSDVELALEPLDLQISDLKHYVTHPGGEKVLSAFCEALGILACKLEDARLILEAHGNMSSPTVLFALERLLLRQPPKGEYGLLTAMGPGFSAEHLIFKT